MPATIGAIIITALENLPLIGPYVASGFGTLVSAFGTDIIYQVVGSTVLIAAELGIAALLMPSPQKVNGQFSVTQPVPFRRRVYGKARIGGTFLFEGDADDRN